MRFRIRDCDNEDHGAVHAAESRYRAYLDTLDKRYQRDLWDFFTWDFFHDGWIDRIWFDDGIGTLKFHIWAPNTKRFNGDGGSYDFIDIGFTCTFRHVANVDFTRGTLEDWTRPAHSVGFRYAEINTSPLLEQLNDGDEDSWDFFSLLIQLQTDEEWIEVVFSDLSVQADEPAAFELMKDNPRFEITAFQGRGLTSVST